MAIIEYRPSNGGFVCRLETPQGRTLDVRGSLTDQRPTPAGDSELARNVALIESLWAFGRHEAAYRRLRSPEKREVNRKAASRFRKRAEGIADVIDVLGPESDVKRGWCSACFHEADHRRARGRLVTPAGIHICVRCGSPTTACAVPRCRSFANRSTTLASVPRYCAEHRHDIPSFERAEQTIPRIDDFDEWREYDKRNAARITKIASVSVVGAAVIAPAAFVAAPVIGGAIGSMTGLSGAAATGHGLALLGGGAVSTGGFGMAGGTAVITVTGAGLGTALGATTASEYLRSDPSFRIEKLRDGVGSPVLLANGFLTQNHPSWGGWQKMIDTRYPDHPVYRIHWGSKELAGIGALAATGMTRQAVTSVVKRVALQASKKAKLGPLGLLLAANDVAKNPWSVARTRAAMTGAALADVIARTETPQFILVGHSLGARVMVTAAQALGDGSPVSPRIETIHLVGAAVGSTGNWMTLNDAVSDQVNNYWSVDDAVLKVLYRTVQGSQKAVGQVGFSSKQPKIRDVNVSRMVDSHSAYFEKVSLL